jgi:hypothetical protein
MRRAKVTLEGLFVLFVGTAVTVLLHHYLIWACVAGAAVCLFGLWVIGRIERREELPRPVSNSHSLEPTPSVTIPEGASITTAIGTGGSSFLVHVAENRVVAPIVDTVATISGSSARWDAAMEVARARSTYYASQAQTSTGDAEQRSSRMGPLEIIDAHYGAGDEKNWWDVTDRIKRRVVDGRLSVPVIDDVFGDPLPGVYKTLRIRYRFRGESRTADFAQYGTAELPPPVAGPSGPPSQ